MGQVSNLTLTVRDCLQVVSLVVRSCRKVHEPEASVEEEHDYPVMLNADLPPEIRIWGWAPVQDDFSARCVQLICMCVHF